MNQISTVAQGVIVAIGTGYNVYATVANQWMQSKIKEF